MTSDRKSICQVAQLLALAIGLLNCHESLRAATPWQLQDIVEFYSHNFEIDQYPLQKVLADHYAIDKNPKMILTTSGNNKGYIANWEIQGNWLYLKEFSAKGENNQPIHIAQIIPRAALPLKADWFTGKLHLHFGDYDYDKHYWPVVLEVLIVKGKVRDINPVKNGQSVRTWNGLPDLPKTPASSKAQQPAKTNDAAANSSNLSGSDTEPMTLIENPADADVIWSAEIGSMAGPISIGNGVLLVGTNRELGPKGLATTKDCGNLVAFSAADGRLLWQSRHEKLSHRANDLPGLGIQSQPFIDGKQAYYVSNRGELVCVNLENSQAKQRTGRQNVAAGDPDVVWTLDMVKELNVFKRDAGDMGNFAPSPLIVGNIVYCVTGNGSTFGYGLEFGKDYVPHPDTPSFVTVSKDTGKVLWTSNAPGRHIMYGQWSSPAIANVEGETSIVFAGGDGWLYGFHPNSGKLQWKLDCNESGATPWSASERGTRCFAVTKPLVSGRMMYLSLSQDLEMPPAARSSVLAIDLAAVRTDPQKVIRWRYDGRIRDGVSGPMTVIGNHVVVTERSVLSFLELATGQEAWRYPLGDFISFLGGPSADNDGEHLLVATADDVMVLAVNGQPKCVKRYLFGGTVVGTPIVHNGVLYVTTKGRVWAIRYDSRPATTGAR